MIPENTIVGRDEKIKNPTRTSDTHTHADVLRVNRVIDPKASEEEMVRMKRGRTEEREREKKRKLDDIQTQSVFTSLSLVLSISSFLRDDLFFFSPCYWLLDSVAPFGPSPFSWRP